MWLFCVDLIKNMDYTNITIFDDKFHSLLLLHVLRNHYDFHHIMESLCSI